MRSLLLLLAALVVATTACVAQGAESTSPRRSLTFNLIPTAPRSDSDKHKCFTNMLALGKCKHELILASFFTERPITPACCRAADEVDDHCGAFTRTLVRSLLPRDIFKRCSRRREIIGSPPTQTSSPRAPPRSPPLAPVPRVSGGGARVPPVPEAQTSARLPPPLAPIAGSSTSGRPVVRLPPPYPVTVPSGTYAPVPPPPKVGSGTYAPVPPPPKVGSGTYAPVVSGSPRAAGEPRSSAVPVNEGAPKPKVISGGSAGGRTRRAPPGSYGPATGAPSATASAPPNYGARTGTPDPKILP